MLGYPGHGARACRPASAVSAPLGTVRLFLTPSLRSIREISSSLCTCTPSFTSFRALPQLSSNLISERWTASYLNVRGVPPRHTAIVASGVHSGLVTHGCACTSLTTRRPALSIANRPASPAVVHTNMQQLLPKTTSSRPRTTPQKPDVLH
eukprot:1730721-Prymnesium_polylepis.2